MYEKKQMKIEIANTKRRCQILVLVFKVPSIVFVIS